MKKFLNYKFLMTILASIIVLLEVLKNVFKLNINIEAIISITIAGVGVLVAIGLVNKNKEDKTIKTKEDLKNLLNEKKDDDEIKTDDE